MSEGVWRSGDLMIMRVGATLPDRCVKTNLPADGQWVELRLQWHHPLLYLVLLANLLIYLIVAHFVSKAVTVRVGISGQAISSRRRTLWVMWGLLIGGAGLTLVASRSEQLSFLIVAGLIAMILAAGVFLWWTRVVVATRIEGDYVWMRGVHPDYLAALPEWRELS